MGTYAQGMAIVGRKISPTYSGYMVEKIPIPRIGPKFIRAKFGTNLGYMSFFNHITAVRG